jgi:hypothetical protein
MNFNYILDEKGKPIPEENYQKWSQWMFENESNRRVASTIISTFEISTIFLGVNHSPAIQFDSKYPILFETAILDYPAKKSRVFARYRTKTEALRGHRKAENEIRKQIITIFKEVI